MHFFRRDSWAAVAAGALVSIVLLAGAPLAAATTGSVHIHAGVLASPSQVRPRLAAGSPKPDWRGADLGNSGDESVNGPAITPTQTFNTNPGAGNGVTQGIELDGAGNILFTKGDGHVYSYTPAGTLNWDVSTSPATFGAGSLGAYQNPVASSDGNIYLFDDASTGPLLKINAATGAQSTLFNYGAVVAQTIKLDDATNNLFFGGQDGFINSYSKIGVNNYFVQASGSTQGSNTILPGCAGAATSKSTFYGEGALDSSDNFYVASDDTVTTPSGRNKCTLTFGTLYKVSTAGAIVATAPLLGSDVSAVAVASNTAAPSGSEVVVDTRLGYVEAFDSASLTQLWSTKIVNGAITSSPLVDTSRNRVYVSDNDSALHALNLTTGAVDTGFNGGTTAVVGGSQGSPILDASGNVYAVDSNSTLSSFDPNGATRYSVPTGIGTGFFSPAIANDGTVYTAGNQGQVSGFNSVTGSTPTVGAATSTSTAGTGAATPTQPSGAATATQTAVSGATATNTTVGGATPTNVPTFTPTNTAINAPTSTATNVPTATNTPTSTATNTPTSTPTNTATPAAGVPGASSTPTSLPGQASGWSKYRSNLHNDGSVNVKLDLSQPPGILFTSHLSPNQSVAVFNSAPSIGPSPDGDATTYRIYQIDDVGRLNSVRPDGSVAWTSPAILGALQIAGRTPFNDYRPGSPAIAADGTIYAVSDADYPNGDSGIWRFDPQTGVPTKFFAAGDYLGGSPVIGPDGTIYAAAINGVVYAINKDGSQRYAYQVSVTAHDCPSGTTPIAQSAPALDKGGNLYVGYGCSGYKLPDIFAGGVLALSPTGSELWHYFSITGSGRTAVQGPEVLNAVVLSPDEQTLYASGYQEPFFALNTASGALKWTFTPTGSDVSAGANPTNGAGIVLSPDGGLVYVSVTRSPSIGISPIYALNASNGSVVATATYPTDSAKSGPAVDGNGNLLVALSDGELLAFSPGLGSQLFDYDASGGNGFVQGPVIGPSGSIFLTDTLGNLRALKQGLIAPTPLPTPTLGPPRPTDLPNPTFTALPPIPTPVAVCPGVATSTNTPTPAATATSTATSAPTGTALPTATACPTVPKGTPGVGTPGAGTPGAGTPGAGTPGAGTPRPGTPGAGTPGPGTPVPGGSTPTPTSGPKPPAPQTFTGNGFKITISRGFLTVGNLVRLRVDTTPTARIAYTLHVSYDYPSVKKGQHAAKGQRTIAMRPIPRLSSGPRSGLAQPGAAFAFSSAAVAVKAAPTATPRSASKAKPTATPRPTAKKSTSSSTCGIVATISDTRILHFTRTADGHGVDQYCLRVGAVPAKAVALRFVMTVQVTTAKKTFPSNQITFLVKRAPAVSRSRTILPRTIEASVRHHVLYTDQTQTISSFTARNTHVTYRIAYPGGLTRTIGVTADRNGNNTTRFRVSYLPRPSVRARVTVSVSTTQKTGNVTRHARTYVLTFYVRRDPHRHY